jgi:Stigma-specific protein, Stig1
MPAPDALDTIARGLAGGMSRRQALLKGGAAFLGAIALTPGEALAKTRHGKKKCPHHRVSCNGHCCPAGQVCVTKHKHGRKIKSCGCAHHQTKCHGHCVNTKTDPHNCGHCGHHCTHGHICHHGRCVCPSGAHLCSGACVTLASDPHNCGACGHRCPSGQVCARGTCAHGCPTGTVDCAGGCVSTASDANNCGACGHVCPAGSVCASGTCTTTCPSGTVACAGACVSLSTDNVNCGACGTICASASQLVCQSGHCKTCSAPTAYCNGECSNFQTDTQNCGACGTPCQPGQFCHNGACSDCPPSKPIGCGGTCYAGTGCCGQGPQTVHINGVGGNYYDCNAQGTPGQAATYTRTMAQEAAESWSNQSQSVASCSASGQTYHAVAVSDSSGTYGLWAYEGPFAGHVRVNAGGPVCPRASDPSWN